MKKLLKQLTPFIFIVLAACQPPTSAGDPSIVQLAKSHSAKKSVISLEYSQLQALDLGLDYSVALTWKAKPNAIIELSLINRKEYLWSSSGHRLTTDQHGVAKTSLSFVPQQVGRGYLKVVAVTTTEQGQASKVFNIPYTVTGANEAQPNATKLILPAEQL